VVGEELAEELSDARWFGWELELVRRVSVMDFARS